MEFTATASNVLTKKTDCLVITLGTADKKAEALWQSIDSATGGLISRLQKTGDLKNKLNSSVLINEPKGLAATRLLVLGGSTKTLNEQSFMELTRNIAVQLTKLPIKNACVSLDGIKVSERNDAWQAQQLARNLNEASYLFNPFKSKKKKPTSLRQVTLTQAMSGPHRLSPG